MRSGIKVTIAGKERGRSSNFLGAAALALLLSLTTLYGCSKGGDDKKASPPPAESGTEDKVSGEERIVKDGQLWINRWSPERPMTKKRAGLGAAVIGNRLYAIGGGRFDEKGLTIFDTVEYAEIQSDGRLGEWKESGRLVVPRVYLASIIHNGWLYIMGGETADETFTGAQGEALPKLLNTLERAKINDDGTLGEWIAEKNTMVLPRRGAELFVIDGWIYAAGGFSGAFLNDAERAKINPDGSIGEWIHEEHFLKGQRYISGFVQKDKNLYLFGGHLNSAERAMDSVEMTTPNPDGTLKEWKEIEPLSTRRFLQTAILIGDTVYNIGGHNTIVLSTTEKAVIKDDGTIGSWTPDTPLNQERRALISVRNGNRIYVLGGMVGPMGVSDSVATVESALVEEGKMLGNWVPLGGDGERYYKEWKAKTSPDAIRHLNHGQAFLEEGKYKTVLFDTQEAIKTAPHLWEAYNLQGDVLYRLGDTEGAQRALEEALKIKKDNFDALVGLSVITYNDGDLMRARDYTMAAADIKPGSVMIHENLGNIHLELGEYGEAIGEFRRVLDLDPNSQLAKDQLELIDRYKKK